MNEAALEELRCSAAGCTACDLYRRATQTVFGEGPTPAALMLLGEQPGNDEDVAGRPFVGPAGRLLDRALAEVGLDRRQVYVTNAVKHFKWRAAPGGKRRIHAKPNQDELEACRPWFQQELSLVAPRILVCLGSTAARAALGRPVTISAVRGRVLASSSGSPVLVTFHPSAALRAPTDEARAAVLAEIVRDLRRAWTIAVEGGDEARPEAEAPGRGRMRKREVSRGRRRGADANPHGGGSPRRRAGA